MSSDLPDEKAERRRNADIVVEHRPAVLIADNSADVDGLALIDLPTKLAIGATDVIQFTDLWTRSCAVSMG